MFIALACSTSATGPTRIARGQRTPGVDQQRVAPLTELGPCHGGQPTDRVFVRLNPAPFGARLAGRIQRRRAAQPVLGHRLVATLERRKRGGIAGAGFGASRKPDLGPARPTWPPDPACGQRRRKFLTRPLRLAGLLLCGSVSAERVTRAGWPPAARPGFELGSASRSLAAGGLPDRGEPFSACRPGATRRIPPATPRPA